LSFIITSKDPDDKSETEVTFDTLFNLILEKAVKELGDEESAITKNLEKYITIIHKSIPPEIYLKTPCLQNNSLYFLVGFYFKSFLEKNNARPREE